MILNFYSPDKNMFQLQSIKICCPQMGFLISNGEFKIQATVEEGLKFITQLATNRWVHFSVCPHCSQLIEFNVEKAKEAKGEPKK